MTITATPVQKNRPLSLLFFLSGVTGLSYEVIWFKQFSHVWGSSSLAMASVVGAFLLCLGIGSRVGGALADRVARPVVGYGLCEIGIGLFALVIPWETNLLWQFSIRAYSGLREFPVWYALVRCATTLLVIGPACLCMGATLPLLVRQCAREGGLGRATGWLYGINTVGAALGCYLIGFHLLPMWGLADSNLATALINLGIGVVALVLGRGLVTSTTTNPSPAPDITTPATVEQGVSLRAACSIAALTGFSALVLQTVWNRQLALVLGSSTYAFSAMLLVVLAGIGLGSLIFQSLLATRGDHRLAALFVIVAIVISTIVGVCLLPFAANFTGDSVALRADYAANALVCITASAIIELVPSLGMGMLFPLLVHLTRQSTAVAGSAVGRIYAWNTAGALAGAVITSIHIIPVWGTPAAVTIALIVYVAAGLVLAVPVEQRVPAFGAIGVATAALLLFGLNPPDLRMINFGTFIYGDRRTEQETSDILFFREGAACNVLVTEQEGIVALRVNGKVDGGTHGDMGMQLGLAFIPRFLNPQAKNVLVIGFGTGTTPGACLLFPDTRVTCCEIEPAVVEAGPFFESVNHSPQDSPNFKVVYDDARAYVQGTDERFDLILSEPSNPWIAGVANLFTREFYEIASRRLAPHGILAQWLQTYAFAPADYAMVVRTMGDIFPHRRLIRISEGDTILIASNDSLDRDADVLRAAQSLVDASPALKKDLQQHFKTTEVVNVLLSRIVLDEPDLVALAEADGSQQRNLDRDCRLEFRAARHMYELRDRTVGRFILDAARSAWFLQQFAQLGGNGRHADALHDVIEMLIAGEAEGKARPILEFTLRQSAPTPALLADELILREPFELERLERLIAISDPSVVHHANRVGTYFAEKRAFDQALTIFERLCERFPKSALLWNNLAETYASLGRLDQAGQAQRQARELDPTQSGPAP